MSDHCEEQEMEAEALTAIFDDCLEIVSSTQPFEWAISLWPEQHSPEENHVGVKLLAKIPLDYPEHSSAELSLEILKGLTNEHVEELLGLAKEEAEANEGMPAIFAICERLREWLAENNVKGMDDQSMYAQMMRREKEAQKEAEKKAQAFEAQKEVSVMSDAEKVEMEVRKRRAEGTPVTKETFETWKAQFEQEMQELEEMEEAAASGDQKTSKSKKEKVVDKSGRISGYDFFSGKAGTMSMEAMEEEWENAERDEDEEEDAAAAAENVDEELFDVDDDDLDDLDFDDDDDDDEDDDDEEEPDI